MTDNAAEHIAIVERFFKVLGELKRKKKIRGEKTFADKYKIGRTSLYMQKKDPSRELLKVIWLYYLIEDYGVASDYLMVGRGPMFTVRRKKLNEKGA